MEGGFGQVLLQAWDAQVTRCSEGQVTRCSGGQVARCSIANCAQALLHFFQNYFDALRRDAEKQFKSAIKQQPMIGTFLMLGKVLKYVLIYWLLLCFVKVYLRLDQPLAALEVRWELLSVFTFFI